MAAKITDSAVKNEAFALPRMADADLEINKKTLVLDLDDTLIHTSVHPDQQKFDFVIEIHTERKDRKFYILKRPGVENLLQELSDLYEIVIFTASGSTYANPMLDKIDPQGKIKHRLTRKHCIELPGIPAIFVKDLCELGRDLRNIIFVDDRPFQCYQSENAYPITAFTSDVSDTALFGLVDFCKRIAASTSDVREEIRRVARTMSASRQGILPHVDKKTLVLKLEGVLVYSTSEQPSYYDFTVDRTRYDVKRPGVDKLIAELAGLFEIVVFSTDDEDFVNGVLDKLDPTQTVFPPTHRLFKRDYASQLGRELCQVIFVDVAPSGYNFQTHNVYPVFEFKDDMTDIALFELTDFCKRVANSTSDVRTEILFHFRPPPTRTSAGWVECVSRSSSAHYYYNVMTKQTTWHRPPLLMPKAEYDALWGECISHDGRKYYYNKVTRESQWHIPPLYADSGSPSTNDVDVDEISMMSSSTSEEVKTSMGGCDEVQKLELTVMFDDHLNLGEKGNKDPNEEDMEVENEKGNEEENLVGVDDEGKLEVMKEVIEECTKQNEPKKNGSFEEKVGELRNKGGN